jgi:hypothetical protein
MESAVIANAEYDIDQQIDALDRLNAYENRLNRIVQAHRKELRERQYERRSVEDNQIQHAANIRLHVKETQNIDYDPQADGFVFSSGEVDAWIRRRDLRIEAKRASNLKETWQSSMIRT